MNFLLLDDYVRLVLEDNGWEEGRVFPQAEQWIEIIEKGGFRCFDCARQILRCFGGLKIREVAPKTGQYFLEKQGDRSQVKEWYLRPLKRLKRLGNVAPENYNGATFSFDALGAFLDREVAMEVDLVERAAGEKLFPIGTIEPDGISYAGESGKIYTLFDDSAFVSGSCVEQYLNGLFLRNRHPKRIL